MKRRKSKLRRRYGHSSMPRARHHRFGVNYYKTFGEAQTVRDNLLAEHPTARVVEYGLGYAVQLRKSGPYYPDDLPKRIRKMGLA